MKKIRDFLFANKSGGKIIIKNFFWLSSSQILSRLAKAFIVIYAARALGASGYGVFSYAMGLAGFFIFFKNIGVDSILTREVAKNKEREKEYFATSFWIEIGLLAITTVLVIFVAPVFSKMPGAAVLFPIIAFTFIFDDLRELLVAFLRGRERMEFEALITLTENIAVALVGFILLRSFYTPGAFASSYLIAAFLAFFFTLLLVKKYGLSVRRGFNRDLAKFIFSAAWPIAAVGFVSLFMFNIDVVMLGWWKTAEDVGFYSAAQRLVAVLSTVASIAGTATMPSFSRLAGEKNDDPSVLLEPLLKSLFLVAIPLVVGGVILRNEVAVFVFGSSYAASVAPFTILIFSVLASFPLTPFLNQIFAINKHAKIIPYAVIASISNILLNLLLIPKYGMTGAAVATVASSFLYASLITVFLKKLMKFKVLGKIKKIISASVIMGLIVLLLQFLGFHVLINIAISTLSYFTVLFILRDELLSKVFSLLRK